MPFLAALICLFPPHLTAQDAGREERSTAWQRDLAAPELDAARMQGFQLRAQQKVQDLAELLTLLSDGSLEPALRKEAEQALLRLFAEPSAKLELYDFRSKKREALSVKQLLTKLQNQGKWQVTFASCAGTAPVRCVQPECAWELNCTLSQTVPNKPPVLTEVAVTLVLKKVKKKLGKREVEAWELFLAGVKTKSRP